MNIEALGFFLTKMSQGALGRPKARVGERWGGGRG